MALILLTACAITYGVAALIGLIQLLGPGLRDERIGQGAFVLGALLHLVAMGARASELGSFPMANTHDALSLFGFTVAALSLGIVSSTRIPQVLPIASITVAIVVSLSVSVEPADAVPEMLRSPWLPLHIAFAYLGSGAFVVGGMVAIVFLVQDSRIRLKKNRRRKSATGLSRLPALELLDRINLRLIELGFPMMTLALLSGVLYGREVWGTWWKWELRNVISVVIWVLFALILHFRITIGWRGRRAALLTLIGVIATLISLVGLNLLGFGHHG